METGASVAQLDMLITHSQVNAGHLVLTRWSNRRDASRIGIQPAIEKT
jgi:hypothetical protein